MTDYVHVAEQIAREAGALLREGHRRADGRVHYKGAVDLVTEYDQRSETLILGRLRAAFPSHAIRAEESGFQFRPRLSAVRGLAGAGAAPAAGGRRDLRSLAR